MLCGDATEYLKAVGGIKASRGEDVKVSQALLGKQRVGQHVGGRLGCNRSPTDSSKALSLQPCRESGMFKVIRLGQIYNCDMSKKKRGPRWWGGKTRKQCVCQQGDGRHLINGQQVASSEAQTQDGNFFIGSCRYREKYRAMAAQR